jgi:hypothetical protein
MLTSRRGIRSYVPALMRLGVLAVCCAAVLAAGIPAVLGQTQEEPAGGLGPPVDATDTDVYVNQFLKTIVASGDTHVAASGAWWGPTDRFFQNQLWTVVKNVQPGAVYAPDSSVPVTATCLLPGKLPGHGSARNTLALPTLQYNLGNNDNIRLSPNDGPTLEVFHTLTREALPAGSIEQRAICQSKQESETPFDGLLMPGIRGKEIRDNFDTMIWFGSQYQPPESDQLKTGNHLALPTERPDVIDGHAWFDGGVEYSYSVFDNGADLLGQTVSGTIEIRGFALVCKLPNCPHTNEPIEIHHHAIKVELDDKDYWVSQHLSPPQAEPLPPELRQKEEVTFALDTTLLSDGWHILSYHAHSIDHRMVPGFTGNQLASEVKIPICIANQGEGACPPAR